MANNNTYFIGSQTNTSITSANMQYQAPLQRTYQIDGYTDCAHLDWDKEDYSYSALERTTPEQLANRCKSSDLVFPQKLHMLLTAAELDEELARIISWSVHGRAFAVHDRKQFVQDVLPKWFLQSRFESFQRQLNLYGFRRITAGPDRGACYHELFLRQRPVLASRIERIRLKGKGPRKPASPDLEPNFYRMSLLPTHAMKKQSISSSSPVPAQALCTAPAPANAPPAPAKAWQPIAPAPSLQPNNGLGALMMRPWNYRQGQPIPQYKPRAMPVSSNPHVVSAPASPTGPVGGPIYPNPPMAYRAANRGGLSRPPLAMPAIPTEPHKGPKDFGPRCVSHLKLADEVATSSTEDDAGLLLQDRARENKSPWATMNTPLPSWAEAAVEETNDEDFASILFELASS